MSSTSTKPNRHLIVDDCLYEDAEFSKVAGARRAAHKERRLASEVASREMGLPRSRAARHPLAAVAGNGAIAHAVVVVDVEASLCSGRMSSELNLHEADVIGIHLLGVKASETLGISRVFVKWATLQKASGSTRTERERRWPVP